MFVLSTSSKNKLERIHPDLRDIVYLAISLTSIDFTVTEGLRSLARQRSLYKEGRTTTLNSRHLTGHAVDLAAIFENRITWEWKYYELIADAMMQAATKLNTPLEWGGNWVTFKDGPHFQLPVKYYPAL